MQETTAIAWLQIFKALMLSRLAMPLPLTLAQKLPWPPVALAKHLLKVQVALVLTISTLPTALAK